MFALFWAIVRDWFRGLFRRQAGLSRDEPPMERMRAVIDLQRRLRELGYIADRPLAATLMLMDDLRRPLLLEGEAGAGKTEVAKVLAQLHATDCVRLQCYEGLDSHAALYEWNYQRQLLAIVSSNTTRARSRRRKKASSQNATFSSGPCSIQLHASVQSCC